MGTFTNKLGLSNPTPGACNWDVDWYRNQFIKDALSAQNLLDNYIVSGGVLSSPSGLNIDMSEAISVIAGNQYTTSGGTLSLNAADPDEELTNWIYINDSGNVVVSDSPITVGNFALIGIVDTDTTSVLRQFDLRRIKLSQPVNLIENDCINGTFDNWQRGTSQTSSGYDSDDRFTNLHSGSSKTHSRQNFAAGQTVVPGNPKYYSRTVVSSTSGSGDYVRKEQRILDVRKYSGKTVCLKFHGKVDTTKNIAVEVVQNFGSGGSAEVNSIGAQKIQLTTGFTKNFVFIDIPSISGKTIGTNSYTAFVFWFDAGTSFDSRTNSLGPQSGTFELSEIEIYESNIELPVRRRSEEEELALCQRYFIEYNGGVFSGGWQYYTTSGTGFDAGSISFPYQMIQTPSITQTLTFGGTASNPTFSTSAKHCGCKVDLSGAGIYRVTGGTIQFDAEI